MCEYCVALGKYGKEACDKSTGYWDGVNAAMASTMAALDDSVAKPRKDSYEYRLGFYGNLWAQQPGPRVLVTDDSPAERLEQATAAADAGLVDEQQLIAAITRIAAAAPDSDDGRACDCDLCKAIMTGFGGPTYVVPKIDWAEPELNLIPAPPALPPVLNCLGCNEVFPYEAPEGGRCYKCRNGL